jgi:hypothetical protein
VVWCGVVWCGVVWCGVVGVVWCDVVWCVALSVRCDGCLVRVRMFVVPYDAGGGSCGYMAGSAIIGCSGSNCRSFYRGVVLSVILHEVRSCASCLCAWPRASPP